MQKRKKIIGLLLMACAFTLSATACSDGKDGIDGVNGTDGKSAYQIWLDNGYAGTEKDFLEWLKGEDGADGKDGTNGTNGIDGVNGTNGVDGKDGANGTNGKDGTNGIDGVNGSDGKDGTNGKDGVDGKSAYQIWLDNGNTGSETDFLEWLKGKDGADGKDGTNGIDGVNGSDGKDGMNGKDGIDGENGLSAYEIFMKYNPDYPNDEEEWINDLVNGRLVRYTVTFKAYGQEDIIKKTPFYNANVLTDIPQFPELAGNIGYWDYTEFDNITQDITVNAVYETQGLIYSLVGDSYSVTDFTNETAEVVFIPQTYFGKDITSIGIYAFAYCDNITDIIISNNITSIGRAAFLDCSLLTNIIIPDSVTTIAKEAFANCTSMENVYITDLSTWCNIKFESYNSTPFVSAVSEKVDKIYLDNKPIAELVIPASITSINDYAFFGYDLLISVTIPDSVTSIGNYAFYACGLTSVTIGDSVTSIGNHAFSYSSLTSVYYKGTAEKWNEISIGIDNYGLTSATLYYYSETAPTLNSDGTAYDGNYWHYDTDGVTPVIWTVKQDEEN